MTTEERTAAIEASGAKPRSEKQPNIIGVAWDWAELDALLAEPDQDLFNIKMSLWTVLSKQAADKAAAQELEKEAESISIVKRVHKDVSELAANLPIEIDGFFMTPTHKHAVDRAIKQITETRDMLEGQLPKEP